jgi:soluble lytic murein transglycosylase-like protein
MKVIGIAIILAILSEPALARESDHHKRGSRHHRHSVENVRQPFGTETLAMAPTWDAQARTTRSARETAPGNGEYAEMVTRHAAANGVPVSLVHRVIMRESRYNPRAVSKGNYGMMQIRLGTARAMGYAGTAAGLLDPEVNMTYAVKYLAGAYKAAGGSEGGAVANYARGYYHQAKERGLSPYEAPGSNAFAMQTSERDIRAGRRMDFDTAVPVMPDRHAVF